VDTHQTSFPLSEIHIVFAGFFEKKTEFFGEPGGSILSNELEPISAENQRSRPNGPRPSLPR